MGMINRILSRFVGPKLRDELLGTIRYYRGVWGGVFVYDGETVILTVASDPSGPGPEHRVLYAWILENLDEVLRAGRSFLKESLKPEPLDPSLRMYSLNLGDVDECAKREFVVEFADEDEVVIHRVGFFGLQAISYTYDC